MKQNAVPIRFRPVLRFRPRAMYVNKKLPEPAPGVGETVVSSAPAFQSDGYVFPRPQDTKFDVVVRVPNLPANNTVEQNVFQQEERIKGGWIRYLGYGFNNPHGFFQVRTYLLINGTLPQNYIFKTVDAAAGTYQGSFPTVQIGTIRQPADVQIYLPPNAVVDIRFVNNSLNEAFSAAVRLKGWSFGN